jgi:hypothetical protein
MNMGYGGTCCAVVIVKSVNEYNLHTGIALYLKTLKTFSILLSGVMLKLVSVWMGIN